MLPNDRPALMGILNVTPDSFSDGGLFFDDRAAVGHAETMIAEGADLLDVGGESTRPGAPPVVEQEELRRVLPVVQALASRGWVVSIDTSKASVARAALAAGASMVNDVTAGRDPEMAATCAEAGATACLMHMQGEPRTMQQDPTYTDVVTEVRAFLVERARVFEDAGVAEVWIDPGIGFGKTVAHNLCLLRHLATLVETGYPVLIGVSRKSFIGRLLGSGGASLPVEERLEGTLAAQAWAQVAGCRVLRAHDVREARRTIEVLAAIAKSE
ncbi:MAG TPA: dihydropteroate synthase [Fimbriimonadaceae bacterium]|nr:dihydropteroate synthase [Fimbriimonadaceae bacterium]